MRKITAGVVEVARRVRSGRRIVGCLLVGSLGVTGCGIGKLDRGKKTSTASAQSQALSDAYKKKMGGVTALPKGGPGSGTQPKRSPPPTTAAVGRNANDTTENKSFRARVVSFFKGSRRKRASGEEEQAPSKMRGRYAMSDSGDFFVPCNDTTRYAVQATVEARYLMAERLRFIVRALKTPVYAVFTGTYVIPKPAPAAKPSTTPPPPKPSTPTAGQKAPPSPTAPAKKAIFVNKVDTLTTTFPSACRPPTGNRSAGG